MSLLPIAKELRDAGLSVIGSSKKGSIIDWKKFQTERPTDEELAYMFITRKFQMLAIVCGQASGNLEVIDVDTKNDKTGKLWPELWTRIIDYYKGNPPFAIIETPSGGIHLYYRCETIEGNLILASRMEDGKRKTMLETRGQGGLVMAPPTKGYISKDDKVPNNIPLLSVDERDDILSICREFNEVFEEEKPVVTRTATTYKITPWGEYNNADHFESVLKEAGWEPAGHNDTWDYWRRPGKENDKSASWHRERRQFYVFSSSTNFEIQKGYRPFDIYKIIKCDGDVRKAITEVKALNFGQQFSAPEEEFIGKGLDLFNNGYSIDDIKEMLEFDFDATFRNVKDADIDQLLDAAQCRHDAANEVFWTEDDKGKLILNKAALGDFLERRGYRLLVEDEHAQTFRIIRINFEKHWAYPVPLDVFRKELENWAKIEGATANNVSLQKLRNLIRGMSKETLVSAMDFLPRQNLADISFLKKAGDDSTQYFAFRNKVLKVTKDDYEPIAYEDLPARMLVWKKDIKQFDFELSDIETEEEFNTSSIWLFFKRISGITPELQHLDHINELPKLHPELSARFNSVITSVGYLLSAHKDEDQPYFPLYEEDTDSSSKGGGTGKGLIFTIIGRLRNVVAIDCKIWSIKDSFPFEIVGLDTDIVHYEDLPENFEMESLNNVITSGYTINTKYEKSFKMSYHDSPKSAGSSNYSITNDADHSERRQKKIYLSRYFNKNYRPKQELGMLFGKDWTEKQDQITYSVLLYCLQTYMINGMMECPATVNVNRKYILEEYKEGFLRFMDSYLSETDDSGSLANVGKWIKVHDAKEEFLTRSEENSRYWSAQRFKKGLKAYADKMGYEFECIENKSRVLGDRWQLYFIFGNNGSELNPFEGKFLKGHLF